MRICSFYRIVAVIPVSYTHLDVYKRQILDLASNIGLIDLLLSQQSEIQISLGTKGITSLAHAIQLLYNLVPYYHKTHQYYQIINILLINNEQKKIWAVSYTHLDVYKRQVSSFPQTLWQTG